MRVWYRVRDFEAGRAFYTQKLGFAETYVDSEARWAKLERGAMKIALSEGQPDEEMGGVATVDVADVRGEAERLRSEGIEVGTVLELHGEIRVVDVYDPDGNRIQLTEDVAAAR